MSVGSEGPGVEQSGGMGEEAGEAAELWETVASEVHRLNVGHKRGINFSQDFAIDRVCDCIEKLRQKHVPSPSVGGNLGGVEELVGLRVELAMEEQRIRLQKAKIEEARTQIRFAGESRTELEAELAAEQAARLGGSEEQARSWRESSADSRKRLSALRSKEEEVAFLEDALRRPGVLRESWCGVAAKLEAEIAIAKADADTAARRCETLASELARVERILFERKDRLPEPAGAGRADPGFSNGLAGYGHGVAGEVSVKDELLRIAGRASENVKSLQQAMAALSSKEAFSTASSHHSDTRGGLDPPSASFATAALLGSKIGSVEEKSSLDLSRGQWHARGGLQHLASRSSSALASTHDAFGVSPGTSYASSFTTASSGTAPQRGREAAGVGGQGIAGGYGEGRRAQTSDALTGSFAGSRFAPTSNPLAGTFAGMHIGSSFASSSGQSLTLSQGLLGGTGVGAARGSSASSRPQSSDLLSFSAPSRATRGLDSSTNILDEAQRVLEKMERLSSMRAAGSKYFQPP
ncbi:unnamed protein product [Polarella glacialis]|uniref:Uncharacterized protein n=1 Tax=Polarella glacialis TaxID=89957 RepID=A0A813JR79_POLGL|nr:unnamed protein product [Polarella glacialis]